VHRDSLLARKSDNSKIIVMGIEGGDRDVDDPQVADRPMAAARLDQQRW
jgi:hypothetical protein